MRLQTSRYNYFLADEDAFLAVNLVSEGVLRLDQEHFELVKHVLKSPESASRGEARRVRDTLEEQGFLVDADIDERKFLQLRFQIARDGSDALGISILPTMRCNFRCPYCYETHDSVDMSDSVLTSISTFVREELPSKNALVIAWFGGEPLLREDVVLRLNSEFKALCEKTGKRFTSHITTNGYLLRRDLAKQLAETDVKFAQITIDGPKSSHDKRRFLENGEGSYDVVIQNTLAAANYMQVHVRVNIDKENAGCVLDLLDDLEPAKGSITLDFARVVVREADLAQSKGLFSMREFAGLHSDWLQEAYRRGFEVHKGYALSGAVYCGAYQRNALIVDPRGDLFNCSEDVGCEEKRVGVIARGGQIQYRYSHMLDCATWSPFDDDMCKDCVALPICMGGCLKARDEPGEERCRLKHTLDQRIRFALCNPVERSCNNSCEA